MTLLRAPAALLFLWVCGRGAVRLLAGPRPPFSRVGLPPLCFAAGLGALAVLWDLSMLCGLGLRAAAVPLCALFVWGLRGFPPPAEGPAPPSHPAWPEYVLLAAVLLGAGSVLASSLSAPLHYWDSRAVWAAKAKLLYYSDTVFDPAFTDPGRVNPHPRYPLLFPMAQALVFHAAGGPDDGAVMLLVGLFFPLLLCSLYETARLHVRSRAAALAAPALVAVLPAFFLEYGSASSGYADTALAMLFCVSAGTALLWRRQGGTRLLLLSAFLAALLPLTKQEGWPLALVSLALAAAPDRPKAALAHLGALVLVAAPWLLLAARLAVDPTDPNDILAAGSGTLSGLGARIPLVAGYFLRALAGLRRSPLGHLFLWGGLWPLFAAACLLALRLRFRDALRAGGGALLGLGLLAATYAAMPGLSAAFLDGNFFRVTQSLTPLAALQIALTLDALKGESSCSD